VVNGEATVGNMEKENDRNRIGSYFQEGRGLIMFEGGWMICRRNEKVVLNDSDYTVT
jgi:hypothetical protein